MTLNCWSSCLHLPTASKHHLGLSVSDTLALHARRVSAVLAELRHSGYFRISQSELRSLVLVPSIQHEQCQPQAAQKSENVSRQDAPHCLLRGSQFFFFFFSKKAFPRHNKTALPVVLSIGPQIPSRKQNHPSRSEARKHRSAARRQKSEWPSRGSGHLEGHMGCSGTQGRGVLCKLLDAVFPWGTLVLLRTFFFTSFFCFSWNSNADCSC